MVIKTLFHKIQFTTILLKEPKWVSIKSYFFQIFFTKVFIKPVLELIFAFAMMPQKFMSWLASWYLKICINHSKPYAHDFFLSLSSYNHIFGPRYFYSTLIQYSVQPRFRFLRHLGSQSFVTVDEEWKLLEILLLLNTEMAVSAHPQLMERY